MSLVIATIICFAYNGSPTQLIYIANIATAIATPVAGFFITRMIFRADVNEGFGNPVVLKYSMLISYVFVLVVTVFGLSKTVPLLLNSLMK